MPITLTPHEALEAATAFRRQRGNRWQAVLAVIRDALDDPDLPAFLRLADIAEAHYDAAVAEENRLRGMLSQIAPAFPGNGDES